jgi:hypothetical protein
MNTDRVRAFDTAFYQPNLVMALGDVDLDTNAVQVSDSYLLQFCNLLSNSIGISEQWEYIE